MKKNIAIFALFLLPLFYGGCRGKGPTNDLRQVRSKSSSQRLSSKFWSTSHPRVAHYIKRYSRTGDPEVLFRRAQPYLPYIMKVFKEQGLPRELVLLPMIESSFQVHARSARARGLWQFTAPTGRAMGLSIGFFSDERKNWKKSTHAAAKYLKSLNKQFSGNWGLTLAAYNAGPGTIRRAMAKQNTNDYWKLKLRQETMNYVPEFLAMIQILKREPKNS